MVGQEPRSLTYFVLFLLDLLLELPSLGTVLLSFNGVRVENSKLVRIYFGFRYVLFALPMIGFISMSIFTGSVLSAIIDIIVGGVYFILDIGLTVILQSIRVDRENNAGTENVMKRHEENA